MKYIYFKVGGSGASCTTDADCLTLTASPSYFYCNTLASPKVCTCYTGFTWNLAVSGTSYTPSTCTCTGTKTLLGTGTSTTCGNLFISKNVHLQ